MRQLLLLVVIIGLCSTIAAAQGNYKAGYIVTLKGDTLKGYIDYRNWQVNPNTFNFKPTTDEVMPRVFDVNNTGSVTLTGFEKYQRFVVSISLDEGDELRLKQGLDTSVKTAAFFLKLVNSGKFASLYSYRDKLKIRFFIAENGKQPSELILHKYLDPNQPSQTIVVDSYKRQLQSLAYRLQPQNEELMQEIQKADFTQPELEDITFKINGSERASTFSSSELYKSKLFVGVGANILTVHNLQAYFDAPPIRNYTATLPVGIELNLGEDIYLKRNSKSLVFRGEVHVLINPNNQIHTKTNDSLVLNYSFTTVTFNPQLLYSIYNQNNMKIYAAAGGELVVRGIINTHYSIADSQNNYFAPYPTYTDFTFYLTLKAGIILNNRLNFYAGYNPNLKNSATNKLSSADVGINYLFGESK